MQPVQDGGQPAPAVLGGSPPGPQLPVASPAVPAPARPLSAYLTRDLTTGSIPRNLWFLAWPTVISGLLQTVDLVAELVWAGFLGFRAIASIGVAQGWVQLFNSGRMGVDTATRAMISRAVGAQDLPLANHVASQAVLFNIGLSFTMSLIGVVFTDFLMRVLGVSDQVIEEGAAYLRLRFVSTASFSLLWSTSSILQAGGDSLTPMKAQIIARLLQITCAPFLIFGWLGLPHMGLAGAAITATLAQSTGACLTFYALFKGKSRLHPTFKGIRPDFPLFWRMLRLGAPASVTSGERSLAQIILIGIVTPFGDTVLAAYSLTQRLQMFVNLGQQGVGQAAGVLTGQNLGARRLERARSTIWWALGYSSLLSVIVGGLILLFPALFLTVFTREQTLLAAAVPWLQIVVIGFMAMGVSNVFMQAFNTAGDTLVPMLVTLGSIWGVQQPAAIILSGVTERWELLGWDVSLPHIGSLGELGIAWAMVLAMAVRIFVYFPYFLWGPWWRKRV